MPWRGIRSNTLCSSPVSRDNNSCVVVPPQTIPSSVPSCFFAARLPLELKSQHFSSSSSSSLVVVLTFSLSFSPSSSVEKNWTEIILVARSSFSASGGEDMSPVFTLNRLRIFFRRLRWGVVCVGKISSSSSSSSSSDDDDDPGGDSPSNRRPRGKISSSSLSSLFFCACVRELEVQSDLDLARSSLGTRRDLQTF